MERTDYGFGSSWGGTSRVGDHLLRFLTEYDDVQNGGTCLSEYSVYTALHCTVLNAI